MGRDRDLDFEIKLQCNPEDRFYELILKFNGVGGKYSKDKFIQEAVNCIEENWKFIDIYQRFGDIPTKKKRHAVYKKRKKANEVRKEANKLRWFVFKRDGFKCQKCRKQEDLSLDHIVPVSKGGKTESKNLQTLCENCNTKKSNYIKDEKYKPKL
jgi:hypothetical protein